MLKGDDTNTCCVNNCDKPRFKHSMCFQHYTYHYGPSITSFETAVEFIAWGMQEALDAKNRNRL